MRLARARRRGAGADDLPQSAIDAGRGACSVKGNDAITRPTHRGLWCATVCAALVLGSYADAYVFFFWNREAQRFDIVASEDAVRWPDSRLPLRFRMLENDYLPTDMGISRQAWAEIVERSARRWTDVRTPSVVVMLEGPPVAADQIDIRDGINTIGFTSDESFRDSWVTGTANWGFEADGLAYCDIKLSPYFVKN